MTVQFQVYHATATDQQAILSLFQQARRSYIAFGLEDLPQMLARGNCMVARRSNPQRPGDDRLWAALCVSTSRNHWAFLRGVTIADGWRTDDGLAAVLEPLIRQLREGEISRLAAYGTALWIVPALIRAGFQRVEWIVTLERHPRPLPGPMESPARTRPIGAYDLNRLIDLDEAVFHAPYQLASGELIELMVTSGHFMIAELEGSLVGYVCADVLGDEGQIMRLAVHPAAQRQGIGRKLLNNALAYLDENGARYAIVNTQESNQASLNLYEGFGFRRVGRRVPLLVRDL